MNRLAVYSYLTRYTYENTRNCCGQPWVKACDGLCLRMKPIGPGRFSEQGRAIQPCVRTEDRTSLKCIMHISSNPLARMPLLPRIPPENLRSIGPVHLPFTLQSSL